MDAISRQAALARRLASGLLLMTVAATAAAQDKESLDHQQAYAACMALAATKPADALASARAWEAQGGSQAARHCAAMAMIGLSRFDEAAANLDALAQELDPAEVALRVAVLGLAGQAWLLAADAERALAAQTAALALAPMNVELLIDRSVSLATLTRHGEALDDLNAALAVAPDRPDILVFRASAYRYLDSPDLARDDVERALALDPDNPDGLLERGILHRIAGEPEAARADWQRVIGVAKGTPAADLARDNLARLDGTAQ